MNEAKKITVRGRGGKCHPAFRYADGFETMACSCPGSQNGSLKKKCVFVGDGWEKANCDHHQ